MVTEIEAFWFDKKYTITFVARKIPVMTPPTSPRMNTYDAAKNRIT